VDLALEVNPCVTEFIETTLNLFPGNTHKKNQDKNEQFNIKYRERF
jgi:hypothetical protein